MSLPYTEKPTVNQNSSGDLFRGRFLPPRGQLLRSRGQRSGKALLRWVIILLVLTASVVGVWQALLQVEWTSEEAGPTMYVVKRGEFLNEITERGDIESASNVEVRCEVKSRGKGGATILWIIPEGTNVKLGDKLIEFDASAFESNFTQQQIHCSNSQASLTKAENDLQNAKESLDEYNEGTYPLEKMAIAIKQFTAKEDQRQAQEKVDYTKELARKGYVTVLRVQKDEFTLKKAELDYKSAKLEMEVLEKYKRPKMLNQLDSYIKIAEASLGSAKAKRDLDLDELKLVESQIEKCTVYAKDLGQVVYANETNRRGGQEIIIEEGSLVREQQVVIRLPDPQRMQVKSKINESKVTAVQVDQRVQITLDAIPNVTLDGFVEKVDEYPAPSAWWGGSVKQYQTYIQIVNSSVPLKPGLTAKVQIEIEYIADCIKVPVQSIFEHGEKHYCVKRDPKNPKRWVAHEVEIGSTNDKFVVITSGLESGEEIVHGAFHYRSKVELPKTSSDSEASKKRRPLGPPSQDQKSSPERKTPPSGKRDLFKKMDKNQDGRVSKDEVPSQMQPIFSKADLNGDDAIDRSEWTKIEATMMSGGGKPQGRGQGRSRSGGGGRP